MNFLAEKCVKWRQPMVVCAAFWLLHFPLISDPCALIGKVAKSRDFSVYAELMDAAMHAKVSRITPFLPIKPGATIVDVGTGTGSLAAYVALKEESVSVIGVDIQQEMIDIANRKYGDIVNLNFRKGVASKPYAENADAVVMATVLHEVFSYSGDSYVAVDQALATAAQSLKSGGTIVIKDFVQPHYSSKIVHLVHLKSDFIHGNSFEKFAAGFAARNRDVKFKVVAETTDKLIIETSLGSAYDYIFRKDYTQNWTAELQELYGYMSLQDIKNRLDKAGFAVTYAVSEENPWILKNRIQGKIWLVDPVDQKEMEIPDYDMLVVATKK